MDGLRQLVDKYIFCLLYPNALLRGISEITESVLKSRGKGVEVSNLLSEITNLIWGSFKNRYIGDVNLAAGSQVQVPLTVNHKRKYISFGSENPQLCFRFTLTNPATDSPTTLFARYIFNLSWSPEDFKEIILNADVMVDSGELELF